MSENAVGQNWVTLLSVIANFASLAGLLFSIIAWRRARGAEKAAKEARAAVRQSNAAENLQALVARAKDLLTSVQRGQMDTAFLCCVELVSAVALAKQRWPLSAESSARLEKTANDMNWVSRTLAEKTSSLKPSEKKTVLEFAHEALRTLADEAGKILNLAEREDQ